jgi:hypothetical protein
MVSRTPPPGVVRVIQVEDLWPRYIVLALYSGDY